MATDVICVGYVGRPSSAGKCAAAWADGAACGSGYRDEKPGASGVGLAVVLSEHLTEAAWPAGGGAAADLTGRDRKTG